jgi:arylsulfatase
MDFFPTFVNLSKADTLHQFKFDGVDITRLLIENKPLPDRSLFWKYRSQKVIRNGKWKLLIDNDTTHLYNLSLDISEQNDLEKSENSIVSQLKLELEKWEQDVSKGTKLKTR